MPVLLQQQSDQIADQRLVVGDKDDGLVRPRRAEVREIERGLSRHSSARGFSAVICEVFSVTSRHGRASDPNSEKQRCHAHADLAHKFPSAGAPVYRTDPLALVRSVRRYPCVGFTLASQHLVVCSKLLT